MQLTSKVIDDFNAKNNGTFMAFDLGIVEVDPERIVALHADVEDIRDSYKMRKLIENVSTYGWTNEGPFGFVLLQFPNGDLAVDVGNHRGYLSKELKKQGILTSVKANIYKIVNVERLPIKKLHKLLFLEEYLEEAVWLDDNTLQKLIYEKMQILQN